jgi:sugar lactone lactonase YvrE
MHVDSGLGSWIARDYEVVAELSDPMPTGVAVSPGRRMFVSFPRWGDDVPYTVAELVDGAPMPYPDAAVNRLDPAHAAETLVSVQSVVVDPAGHLWLLDSGSIAFAPHLPGAPKLVEIDLERDEIVRIVPVTARMSTTYLNDVRFDLSRGGAGYAYVTDSRPAGALIVVDLATGRSWPRLRGHRSTSAEPGYRAIVEGRVRDTFAAGADGIALSADGSQLYYCALASRRLYSVSTDLLIDEDATDDDVAASIVDLGDKGASDGMESDSAGSLYVTSYEHRAVFRLIPGGRWETVMHGPELLWPDTLALADDGYLYVSANQLPRMPRYTGGADERVPPYHILRKAVTGRPVRLRRA